MWYGQKLNGQHFYSKVKPFNFGRDGCGEFFKAKTKKDLFKMMGRIE